MSYFDIHAGSFWRARGDQPLMYRRRLKTIESTLPGTGHLLDVGCGEGFFAMRASSRGWDVTAIDGLEDGVRMTRARAPSAQVFLGDAEDLDFADSNFDVVTAWDLLEHLRNPEAAIREVSRVLRSDGLFAFSTPNTNARSVVTKGKESTQFRDLTHVSLLSPAEWVSRLTSAGFELVSLGTDAYWDTPYPGTMLPNVVYKLHAQVQFASRYSSRSRSDGENLLGLCRKTSPASSLE